MVDIDVLTSKSKKVIDSIEYIDLATLTEDGKPWNLPLWFVRDDKFKVLNLETELPRSLFIE